MGLRVDARCAPPLSSLCRNQDDRAYILTDPCVGYRMAKEEEQEKKTALSD